MVIEVIIWKLANTVIPETVIGEYATLVFRYMQKKDFDCNSIENCFNLSNSPQAKVFTV
jgi:hypothetical protein